VASVKVRDGLILGADSMTQIQQAAPDGNVHVMKAYSNARKLFQINDAPIGVTTWGPGNLGNRSIEGMVLDFCRTDEASDMSVLGVASALHAFVRGHYEQNFADVPVEQRPVLGFYIAGYTDGAPFPDEYEFELPNDTEPQLARSADAFGSSWRGIWLPFTRLYYGFDPIVEMRLRERGFDDQAMAELRDGLETQVIYDGMPVQDAINFCAYILETTIGWATYAIGVPSCGHPLQIATILADGSFNWVARPELRVGRT